MYEQYGLEDPFFLMLYGGATMLALTECCYMLVALRSTLAPHVVPPRGLRYWTAAFFAAVAASHLWWAVLGIIWLKDDRLTRNIVTIMLDYITLVPLVMAVLLSMLQDRKRPLWPFFVAHIPIIMIALYGIMTQSAETKDYIHYYQVVIIVVFIIYYVRALIQYDRWLRENYADLEHKEVWQSLLFLAGVLAFYYAYTSNLGELFHEYLSQVNTLIILIFLSWRVETLQMLSSSDTDVVSSDTTQTPSVSANTGLDIGSMLQNHCEATQLYLRHDLTLSELAAAIGTNRTYLSSYFSQQGDTYNAYINRLRIEHFVQLYHEAVSQSRPFTALELSQQCGYRIYRTFSAAFRQHMGVTVTAWMQSKRSTLTVSLLLLSTSYCQARTLTLAEADTIITILLFVVILLIVLGGFGLHYNRVITRRNEQLHRILNALNDYRAIVAKEVFSLDEQEEMMKKNQPKSDAVNAGLDSSKEFVTLQANIYLR